MKSWSGSEVKKRRFPVKLFITPKTVKLKTLNPPLLRELVKMIMDKSSDINQGKHLPLELYSSLEVCSMFKISRSTLYYLPIPFVLIGKRRRYRKEIIEQYLFDNSRSADIVSQLLKIRETERISDRTLIGQIKENIINGQ